MKTRILLETEVVFTVEYFEPTEGGMDSDQYGGTFANVVDALTTLLEATRKDTRHEWIIVGRAKITAKEVP